MLKPSVDMVQNSIERLTAKPNTIVKFPTFDTREFREGGAGQ